MFFNHNAVRQTQALTGAFARLLGGKKQVENFFLDLCRNTGAVIPDQNFDAVGIMPTQKVSLHPDNTTA